MSYDYERYDGKRIVVDGEVIGLLAMEFGHEVEEVCEEYHAELAMTKEQERQSEAYKESLRSTLSAQYKKVAALETENAKLREYITKLEQANIALDSDNTELRDDMRDMQMFVSDNTKLRELVRAMYYCHLPWSDCDKCVMNGADMHVEIDEMEFCDGMNDRLRKLGVVK